jgi:hypothetical protein
VGLAGILATTGRPATRSGRQSASEGLPFWARAPVRPISSAGAILGDSVAIGAAGKCTDRPTIIYVPLTGEKFLRGLLTPIAPKNIFSLMPSG